MHYAAQSKDIRVVEALIGAGANVNAKAYRNVTPLMLSVDMAFGQPDIALALIRSGANVNDADTQGNTALIIATTESSVPVMKSLLQRGADPNARGLNGETALHWAAMNAFSDRAELLLEYGADPSLRDSAGMMAYDVAQTTSPDEAIQDRFRQTRKLLAKALEKRAAEHPH